MTSTQSKPAAHAKIASHVPGRIRLKMQAQHRNEASLACIGKHLSAREGIHEVRTNPVTGSLTLHYDHARHSMAGILGFLEDLDVMVESIGHLPSVGESGASANGESPEFIAAVNDLNARLSKLAGFPVNLKALLPLLFVGAGVWSIGRRGLMIEAVPGWLFLWFAFDMFVKLHSTHRQP